MCELGYARVRPMHGIFTVGADANPTYAAMAATAMSAAKRSTVSGVVSQAHMRRQPVSPRNV